MRKIQKNVKVMEQSTLPFAINVEKPPVNRRTRDRRATREGKFENKKGGVKNNKVRARKQRLFNCLLSRGALLRSCRHIPQSPAVVCLTRR